MSRCPVYVSADIHHDVNIRTERLAEIFYGGLVLCAVQPECCLSGLTPAELYSFVTFASPDFCLVCHRAKIFHIKNNACIRLDRISKPPSNESRHGHSEGLAH